jgi:DNA-directed RNA polymerase specialized sigma24 family protein
MYFETPTEQHLLNKRVAREQRAEYQRLRDRQTAIALKAQGFTLEEVATKMSLPLVTVRRYTRSGR